MDTNISLTKKFLTGESYYRFSSIATKGLGFMTTLFVLHSLTLYQYGVFQLLLSIFGAGMVVFYLAGNVVGNDIQRFIAAGQEGRAKKLFTEYNIIRLSLGVLLTLGMVLGAPLLSRWYQPDFIQMLQIVGLYFFVEALSGSLLSLVKVRLNFRAAAMEPAYGKVGQLALLIVFSLTIGISTREALIAGLIGNIVAALTMLPGARASWRQWRGVPLHHVSVLWGVLRGYGKWDTARQVVSNLVSNIQPWLIKVFISTEAVAIYSVALTMVDLSKTFLSFNTLSSIVPRQLADAAASRRTFVLSIKYLLWMAVVCTAVALVAGPLGIATFFPKYLAALPYFAALVWTVPLVVFTMQAETFLVALREQRFLFLASLSRNAVTPLLLVATLPVLGLWGVVATKLLVTASLIVAELRYLFRKHAHLRFVPRELLTFTAADTVFLTGLWRHSRELLSVKVRSVLG